MQDLTAAAAYYHQSMMTTAKLKQPELPEQEQLTCPRCDSPNTKFCYYNNYNLSQPRHFCKNCRRYWTKGGALRNIPVGGGSRKNNKRSGSSSSSSSSTSNLKNNNKIVAVSDQKLDGSDDHRSPGSKLEQEENSGQELDPSRMFYGLPVGDPSFSSLLAANMQMGGIVYDSGSRLYSGTDLGLGIRRNYDTWTDDLAMNRVEKH